MNKFIEKLQKILMPLANKMNKNKFILSMRDGFMLALPFTMTGSILTAFAAVPFFEKVFGEKVMDAINTFVAPSSTYSNSIYSLFIVVGIAYSLAKRYADEAHDKNLNPLNASFTALVCFLITIPTSIVTDGGETVTGVLKHSYVGASAIFTAILMAFGITMLYRWAVNHKLTIKLPDSVPQSIQDSFTSFLPAAMCMFVAMALRAVFAATPFETVNGFTFRVLQQPMAALGNSAAAAIISAGVLNNIFWFFGLHGQTLVSSVFSPFWKPAAAENIEALAAGQPIPNLVSSGFVNTWLWFGGWISVPLLIALYLYTKKHNRKDWRDVMKVGLIPGLFNIYEPLMFGLPLVLNPFMLAPMIITPLISGIVGYVCTITGIVPYCTGVDLPITTPLVINGILGTNSISAGIVQLILIPVLVAVWYLFLGIEDRAEREQGIYVEEDETK